MKDADDTGLRAGGQVIQRGLCSLIATEKKVITSKMFLDKNHQELDKINVILALTKNNVNVERKQNEIIYYLMRLVTRNNRLDLCTK